MPRIERYGRGEEAQDLSPGDFILAHRHHIIAGLISLAEKRRFRGADAVYAHWSHSAVVDTGDSVIEAEIRGIVRSPISKYRDDEYHLVRLGAELDAAQRERVVAYARSQIGQAFGFLDLLGACLYLVLGRPVRWVRRRHEICSSLVVRALQDGGLLKELDPALTLPADLAKRFDVRAGH
jgi:uncharacterized protein YycO